MEKILLIDQNEARQKQLSDFLRQNDFETTSGATAEHALSLLSSLKPALIILNLDLPQGSGFAVLKTMPNEPKKRIPVLGLSDFLDSEMEKKAIKAGAADVVSGSTEPKQVLSIIGKILKQKGVEAEPPKEKAENPPILVVDDEEGIRMLLRRFFEKKGYPVFEADSGEKALEVVKSQKPAMVLLDITLPGMDGISTLREIRALDPKVGIVMATGLADEALAKEASDLGAYAYVLKPFDLEYLDMVVLTRLILAS